MESSTAASTPERDEKPFDDPMDIPEVNMVHLELFNQFATDTFKFTFPCPELAELSKDIMLKQAFSAPYLMHQFLAMAARHLSVLDPGRELFLRQQATQLQLRGLTLFNRTDLSTSSRVPILLFSASLGCHALCDALSHRDDFPAFLEKFVSYLHLHRGVGKIVDGNWSQLLDSELRPVLEAGREKAAIKGLGHECDALRERIRASDLPESSIQACQTTIDYLQWVLDSHSRPEQGPDVLLSMAVLMPLGFVDLLVAGRPEAIAVLAYYAAGLHKYAHIWVVRDSGQFMIRSISQHLGPDWADVMQWPIDLLYSSM